jgi:hypothetical protein
MGATCNQCVQFVVHISVSVCVCVHLQMAVYMAALTEDQFRDFFNIEQDFTKDMEAQVLKTHPELEEFDWARAPVPVKS